MMLRLARCSPDEAALRRAASLPAAALRAILNDNAQLTKSIAYPIRQLELFGFSQLLANVKKQIEQFRS
jgi:hypothetical protein